MNVSLTDLKTELVSTEARATQLRTVISGIEALGLGTSKVRSSGPSPAGARKSIYHPNETDIAVLDAMLKFEVSEETPKLQMDWIAAQTGIEKVDVQRSIKYLNTAQQIETQGRGRGTHYEVKVTTNDLQPVDPTTLGDNYRKAGGPTVRQICRAVFNGLEPAQRVAPAKVTEIAQVLYPESNLTRQSFGQVFTKMASAGELLFEGDGRSRKYWRGMDQLDGGSEVPEGFDFAQFFPVEPVAQEPAADTSSDNTDEVDTTQTTVEPTSDDTNDSYDDLENETDNVAVA